MERPSMKLSKLLAEQRRSVHQQGDGELPASLGTRTNISVTGGNIDTSPITSPENLANTRRRLSRMLVAKDVSIRDDSIPDISHHRRELFSSTIHGQDVAESRRPLRNPKAFYAVSTSTPLRARKRVTIEERATKPEDLPQSQKLNRVSKRALTRSRSLSPLPTRYNQASSHYPQRDLHDMDIDEEGDDSIFQLDFNAFQDADCRLVSRFGYIAAAVDARLLHAEVSTAASTLAPVGVASARYWALDEAHGTLNTQLTDGSTASLNPYQTELLMDFARDSIQAFGAGNADMLHSPAAVFTWLPTHPAHHAVLKIASHGHSGRRLDAHIAADQNSSSDSAKVAVHALKIVSRCTDSSRFGKTVGILLVTELVDPTLPFASTLGIKDHNMLKLRRYMVLQMLQKLALAVEAKVSLFDAQREQAELVRFIEETRSALGQRDLDLLEKDGVIATRESVLRAKAVHALCSDALVTCAALLSEGQLQSSVIASAVAKSGCIRDKTQHNLSNCWLLFKENDFLSASGSTTSYYPSELQSVCAISGLLRDGHSPVALISAQNKLVSRLLHGDHSAQSALRLHATRQELHDAGLVVTELEHAQLSAQQQHQWAQSYSVVAVSLQLKLVDRLAYNCPGHCSVLASVVIVIPECEETDLFASHAISLAHLAQRGFTSAQSWHESTLRQSLLSIPSALYEAVTTVTPVPAASESFSSPQKSRGGAGGMQLNSPAPVAHQPHYQRALMTLLARVDSQETAAKFSVRKSALIVSDICGAHWKLCSPPAESRKLSFLQYVGAALQSVPCPTIDLSATSWLQDLYSGKIVFYDSAEHQHALAAVLPEAYNVDQSLRGAVSKQSRMVSPPYVQAQQLLKTLVQAVDPHAAYCALIPIRTAAGLSVLLLFDKLATLAGTAQSTATTIAARADVIPFSAAYMDALLAAGVCKDLTQAMVIVQQQSSAYWAERELSEDIDAHATREDKLCALVASVRQRAEVTTCFARWRHAALHSTDQLALSKHRNVLSAVLALVTHRFRSDVPECTVSFLGVLEAQLRILYPLDSVTVTASSGGSSQASGAAAVQVIEDTAHVTLQRDVTFTLHDTNSGTAQSKQPSRRTLATIRVSRPVLLNRPFLPGEVEDLDVFCAIAGDVFGALARGHSNDLADGDVRSLVFPLLRELVPGILDVARPGHVQSLLPLLVQWLKRICGADMVLLRLSPQREGESETLLSSEEVDASQAAGRASGRLGCLGDLTALQAPPGSSAESPASASANSITLKLLQPQAGSGGGNVPSLLGEVKILSSSKKQFTAEQSAVAQVVSYLLAYVLRCDAQNVQWTSHEAQLTAERQQLHNALTAAKQAAQVEAQSADAFKARLANILSTIMLTDKIATATTLDDLASLVSEGIPRLVGVSSAVLLVAAKPTQTAAGGATKAPTGLFRVVLPKSTRASDSLDSSNHTAAASSTMAMTQLQQIPGMFESGAASQCKIDLLAPHDDSVFGSILLFRTPLATGSHVKGEQEAAAAATFALWEGLEDILRNALSSAIYQCTDRITAAEEADSLTRALHRSNSILQDQAHLEPDVANLLGIKADLEEQRAGLQSEVASLRTKIDAILADRKTKLDALESEIAALKAQTCESTEQAQQELAALEKALGQERSSYSKISASKQEVLALVSSFSFDQRCGEHDSILLWLCEIAEAAKVSLQLVGQTEGGALTGVEGIRGFVAAVGEAVRTGMTVEFTSTGLSSHSSTHEAQQLTSSAMRFTRSDGRSANALQLLNFSSPVTSQRSSLLERTVNNGVDAGHFAVLCVPNRCTLPHTSSEHACFVFVKPVSSPDDTFSAEERDLLNCAANLSSRTLVQTAAQQTEKEFRRVEAALRDACATETFLRRVIAAAESLRQHEYATFADVDLRVGLTVQELLARGDRDTCVIEAALWFPPWNSAADVQAGPVRSGSAVAADQEALARVLSTGQRLRRRSCCWVPLVNHRGEIRAVLRTERRFSDHAEVLLDSPVSSIDGSGAVSHLLPTMAHLVISDLEEEMLTVFASCAAPLLDRMDLVGEACHSVQQAGQAILAIQTVKEAIEDKCALEVSHRLQLEDALKAAAEMLGMTHSARAGTDQLLDATRKNILTFTSSVDCFVIMPAVGGRANKDNRDDLSVEDSGSAYCTFTSDLPREISVDFEPGDLEAAAMQNFSSIRAAGGTQSAGMNGLSTSGARAWQSWAVRRVKARTTFDLDDPVAENYEGGGSVSSSMAEDLFTLAVPFALRSGAVAVISVVRRSAPFTQVDRECITWVSKVLSYCLEMKGGEETIGETLQQVKALQEELSQLRQIDSRLAVVEEGGTALEHALSSAKYNPSLLRELDTVAATTRDPVPLAAEKVERAAMEAVTAAARATFGHDHVTDAWQDTASPTGWHARIKGLPKSALSFENGTAIYWVDAGVEVDESVPSEAGVFKEGDTRMRFRRQQEALHAADDKSVTHPRLFLQVSAAGYPKSWIEVTLEPKLQEHLRLRVAVLMQLLQTAEPWRTKTLALHQQLCASQQALVEERATNTRKLEAKGEEMEALKASFASNLGGTKDKYKTIVIEKSASYRRAEKIFTETLILAQSLRERMSLVKGPGPSSDAKVPVHDEVLDVYMQFGRAVQSGGGLTVTVGQCPLSVSSEGGALALPTTAATAAASSRTKKPVRPSSAALSLEGVQWLGEAARKRSHTPSAPVNQQHAAIHVELYGGKAHTNPLQIALATGKIILFLPEASTTTGTAAVGGDHSPSASHTSTAAVRESLLSVCRKLDPAAAQKAGTPSYVCLNPTEEFPLYSIIVPVALVKVGVTVLVVVRPTSDNPGASSNSGDELSKYVLYSVLAGVLTLKQTSLDILRQQAAAVDAASRSKQLAVQVLKQSALSTEVTQKTQALVFEKMRTARLASKLTAARAAEIQLVGARAQVRHLEQLNADWTEMVKGITGASGGIQTGVAGLWAQACPTLMDLLSSHVKLIGCGLIVPNDGARGGASSAEGVVEYTVRELSTPTSPRGGRQRRNMFSPVTVGELEDYSRGTLEFRPASDLGSNVHNLVLDILAGRTGAQRIFKLARGRSVNSEDDASLWLVPIRTARSVLGVLRVSVDSARTPRSSATAVPSGQHLQPPRTPTGPSVAETGMLNAEALDAAQSSLINFAEVLAPLHLAAQLLDRSKQLTGRLEHDTHRAAEQAKASATEVSTANKRAAMLASTVKCLGVLSRSELHLPFTAPEECLRIYCNRLAIELSQQLSGRVIIHIHRNILGTGGDGGSAAAGDLSTATTKGLTGFTAGAEQALTEHLLDAQGNVFGSVSVSFATAAAGGGSGVGGGAAGEGADPAARKLYATAVGKAGTPGHTATVAYVLNSVSVALAGLLLRTAREISIKCQVASSQEAVQALEEALQREQESTVQLQQVQEEHVVSNDFYRGLADVLNQCLVYCSSDQEARFKYPGDGETYSFARCAVLLETLGNLSVKLPSLVGHSCSFNFALLDSKASSSGDETRGRAGKQVTWVHASKEDAVRALDWHNLSPDARDLVMNLAHTCISKRAKSVCDIGVNLDAQLASSGASVPAAVERLSTVRVLSYPLVDQNTSTVLGVVQCLIEPVSFRPMVENLCEDVTNCLACVLSVEAHQQRLCGKTQTQKLELLTAEMKSNEVLQLKEMWQQRSRAWSGLCQLSATLTRASCSSERFIDVIGSEAVVAILSDTGVRISLRPGSISEAHRQVLSLGSKTVLAHAVLPVTDAGDLVAEIVCEKASLGVDMTHEGGGAEGAGVATIAAELVETVAEMFRGALAVHKLRQQEAAGELRQAREQLHVATQDLQEQARRYEQLKSTASTAIKAMTAQIEELCDALSDGSSVGASDLSRIMADLAAGGSKDSVTYSRKGFGEAKQPDPRDHAAGRNGEDSEEQVVGLIVQPVADMMSALRRALVRLASLQEKKREEQKRAGLPPPKTVQQRLDEEALLQIEHTLQQLSKTRKVHRVVCREAAILLDPPHHHSHGDQHRHQHQPQHPQDAVHPASLTPLAASQDSCLKLLTMVRTLLRSEGQSLLLRDPGTDPVTYQVIYTGDSLHWPGIGQATFGVVSSSTDFVNPNGTVRTSIAETAMHMRKTLQVANAPMDPRYNAYVDGICDLGTPVLTVPMRGRGGSVVGVLIAARGKGAAPFTAEDIMAAEICSALGALSLYWCQGMGSLHHQLVQGANKTIRLERQLERLQQSQTD